MVTQGCDPLTAKAVALETIGAVDSGGEAREIEITFRAARGLWVELEVASVYEGVAQMLFFESDEVCEVSYKDRGGKYQGQRGVTLPKA